MGEGVEEFLFFKDRFGLEAETLMHHSIVARL